MKLSEYKNDYDSGKMKKTEFIDAMYVLHLHLFDYAEFIKNSNVSAIEIQDGRVVAAFRDPNIKFICKPNDRRIVPFETLNFGSYEQNELSMQMQLMDPVSNILDIGANDGWYAINFAKRLPQSKVYAFEPILHTYQYLTENIILNNIKNIETYNFGFSNIEGSFDFYFDPALTGNASLANVSGIDENKVARCKVKRLDDFIKEKQIDIDFIKCDVEGAELLVLQGGMNSLANHTPVVFLEMLRKWSAKFHYHPNDIISLMHGAGYQCYTVKADRLCRFDRVDDDTIETNYFFLHTEKHSQLIKKYVI